MKFKLDENFGTRTQELFSSTSHDIQTVLNHRLQGCSDKHLYEICCKEDRCLITLDLDFADITRFPPSLGSGIVVIRLPNNPSINLLEQLINQFLKTLSQMSVDKKLWIVEPDRIRIHESDIEEI